MELKLDNKILDVSRVIDDIRKSANSIQVILSEDVKKNLETIQQICNKKYSNQTFYGAAALNRQILLDEEIANLLTADTLYALFQLKDTQYPLYRNSSTSNLASVLYWGFKEGLDVIRVLPNNERKYGLEKYEEQQAKFYSNTLRIMSDILKVAEQYGLNISDYYIDSTQDKSLTERFITCSEIIQKLKKEGKGDTLAYVPSYSADQIREQCISGLDLLCKVTEIKYSANWHMFSLKSITITDPNISTLAEFVNHFINQPEALLNGWVSHLFYDRAHLEACLEQNNTITIGNNLYTVSNLIKEMVKQADKNEIVKEQLSIRFKLVEMDLKQRFPTEYNAYQAHGPKQITAAETLVAEKINQLLLSDHFKGITNNHHGLKMLSVYNEEDYFAKFLEICDSKDGDMYSWFRKGDIQKLYQLGIKYSTEPTEPNLQELDQHLDKLLGAHGKIALNSDGTQPMFFRNSQEKGDSKDGAINENGTEYKSG